MFKKLLITAISASTCLLANDFSDQPPQTNFEYNAHSYKQAELIQPKSGTLPSRQGFLYTGGHVGGSRVHFGEKASISRPDSYNFEHPGVELGYRSQWSYFGLNTAGGIFYQNMGEYPNALFGSIEVAPILYLSQKTLRPYLGPSIKLFKALTGSARNVEVMRSLSGIAGLEWQTTSGKQQFVHADISYNLVAKLERDIDVWYAALKYGVGF